MKSSNKNDIQFIDSIFNSIKKHEFWINESIIICSFIVFIGILLFAFNNWNDAFIFSAGFLFILILSFKRIEHHRLKIEGLKKLKKEFFKLSEHELKEEEALNRFDQVSMLQEINELVNKIKHMNENVENLKFKISELEYIGNENMSIKKKKDIEDSNYLLSLTNNFTQVIEFLLFKSLKENYKNVELHEISKELETLTKKLKQKNT